MDLRRLRYFVSIVEHQSFSKAALALHIAQPALSIHIRNMEAGFGTALLERTSHGVKTTAAGEVLLRDARLIIQQYEATRREIQGYAEEPHGQILIGVPTLFNASLCASMMVEARQQLPKLSIKVEEEPGSSVLDGLREGRIDIGLLYAPMDNGKLVSTKLLTEDLLLVEGVVQDGIPRPGRSEAITYDDLASIPLILPLVGHAVRDLVVANAVANGVRLRVQYEVESHSCMMALMMQQAGCAMLPASAVRRAVVSGVVHARPVGAPPLKISTYLVHRADTPNLTAIKALTALCMPRSASDPSRVGKQGSSVAASA